MIALHLSTARCEQVTLKKQALALLAKAVGDA